MPCHPPSHCVWNGTEHTQTPASQDAVREGEEGGRKEERNGEGRRKERESEGGKKGGNREPQRERGVEKELLYNTKQLSRAMYKRTPWQYM